MAVSVTQPDGPKRCMRLSSSTKGGQCDGAPVYASPLSPRCAGVDCLRVWCGRPVASCGAASAAPKGWQGASCEEPRKRPGGTTHFGKRYQRTLLEEKNRELLGGGREKINCSRRGACFFIPAARPVLQVSCD